MNQEERLISQLAQRTEERDEALRQRDVWQVQAEEEKRRHQAALAQGDLLAQRIVTLSAQLGDPLRVARAGGRDCMSCGREIRRGEAYELREDLGPDVLDHVHCPDTQPVTEGATTA